MRWVWIDRFQEFHSGQSAIAIKVVSAAEDHVHNTYPGLPMMPDSLVIEGLAQTGGLLTAEANGFRKMVVLAKIPKIVFHGHARPGDVLYYHARLLDLGDDGSVTEVQVLRDGTVMAEGEIMFAHLPGEKAGALDLAQGRGQLQELLETARRNSPEQGGPQ